MVRWISTLRGQGMGLEDAIVAGRVGTLAADPHDVDRGHLRPLAGLAGHRPGLRRAAAAGHGHRLGAVQLDDAHALRGARLLPHPGPRICPRPRPRRPVSEAEARSLDRALARRDHDRHRGLAGTPPRPRRPAGRVPYLRRNQPRVRPRDRRREGRGDARLHRDAGATGRAGAQGHALCRGLAGGAQGIMAGTIAHAAALPRRVRTDPVRTPSTRSTAISSWRPSSRGCPTRITRRSSTRSSAGRGSASLFAYDETVQRITLGPQGHRE